jgi:hypothetical protein
MGPYKASPALEAWILRAAPSHFLVDRDVSWEELQNDRAGDYPIPVSTLNCEHTVFSSVRVNCAMRALHDHVHLTLGRGFDFESELAVSDVTSLLARVSGLPEADIRALEWDAEGQTRFHRALGYFPKRQDMWAAECAALNASSWPDYLRSIANYSTKGYDNA